MLVKVSGTLRFSTQSNYENQSNLQTYFCGMKI